MTPPPPILIPRRLALDLSGYGVRHPDPFLLDITIGRDRLSATIEHVSNIEYVRWLDRAAELHGDHVGDTRQRLHDQGVMWFVARHEIDYLAEVWAGDALVVATWVRSIGRVKSWRDYLVLRERDRTVVCRAATLWVLVDLATRRPIRIDAEVARRYAPLEATLQGPRRGKGEPSCTSR